MQGKAFNHHKIYEIFSEREIKTLMKCVVIVKGHNGRFIEVKGKKLCCPHSLNVYFYNTNVDEHENNSFYSLGVRLGRRQIADCCQG